MDLIQLIITILGGSAIYFVGLKNPNISKYGFILGLASQPFWLITTYQHEQWGIFVLSLWYTFSWGQGVYNNFIRK